AVPCRLGCLGRGGTREDNTRSGERGIMLIFDAHLDMAWNACEWNRNLMLPVSELRQFEKQFTDTVPGDCTVSWPELKRGKVATIIATLLPRMHRKHKQLT